MGTRDTFPSLDTTLALLQAADLVKPLPEMEPAYAFKHGLTQEAAYDTLLRRTRRDLHRHVAEAYETLYPDRLDEFAARLAEHYAEAGDPSKTVEYAERAGDAALRVYAVAEATAHFTRALDACHAPECTGSHRRALYFKRGRSLELGHRYIEAFALYAKMEAEASADGDRALELAALMAQATLRSTATVQFDAEQARILLERALALAESLDDRATQSTIFWNWLNLYRLTGRVPEAAAAGEKSLALARELGLREQQAYTLNDLGQVFLSLGQVESARAVYDEVTHLWRTLDNLPMLADSLATLATVEFGAGAYDRSIQLALESHAISQSTGNVWGESYSHYSLGMVYFEQGRVAEAIAAIEYCISRADLAGFVLPQAVLVAHLGWIHAEMGNISRGLELVGQASRSPHAAIPIARPWVVVAEANVFLIAQDLDAAARVLSGFGPDPEGHDFTSFLTAAPAVELAYRQGDDARARAEAERSLPLIQRGIRPREPEIYYWEAQALQRLGQLEEGETLLRTARDRAEALGSRRTLWPILAALSESAAARGDASQAQALRVAAQIQIAFISDHAPADLRASFLARPEVQKWVGPEGSSNQARPDVPAGAS